ncbi:MAG: amidase [Actinobacteria bacterium]|nr:amidase [Actinomycetota bacterium]
MDELAWLDATAQAELVRRGELRPDELVDAALARIDAVNPQLNAVVTLIEPRPAQHGGAFAGVPLLLKDLWLQVAGTRLSEGSRWLADRVSTHDGELALRYRRAGLVIVGKTNTCEFGLSPTVEPALFGAARNPWDPTRSTGGSSGGSAAAVAAGLVPMAYGNDLGGSIRYPAAWCGVFGLKPTRGRVPAGAHGDVVSGYGAEHVLTRSVRDSAALLDAVSGPAHGDPSSVPPPARPFREEVGARPGRLRIAVCTRPRGGQQVDPVWSSAAERAGELLEQLGHTVEEASPDGLDDRAYEPALRTFYGGAIGWVLGSWCRRLGRAPTAGEIEPQTRALWDAARGVSAVDYLLAIEALQRISRRAAAWFETYDAWLTPTLGAGPAPLGELVGTEHDPLSGNRNAGKYLMFDGELANVTGNPAMSVPFGFSPDGLPVGVHVLGRFGDESALLRLAGQLEEAMPWAHRRPVVGEVLRRSAAGL